MKSDVPNIRERCFEVDQNFDGWRLDKFLANRMGRLSRSRAAEIARHGDVEVHPQRKVKAGTRLRDGDRVVVREHLPPELLQDDEVRILHRDEATLVLDKPAGMLVHEAAFVRLNTIDAYLERAGFEGAEAVHRIDRETTGCLVCSATAEWVAPLREMFATAAPQKLYRALVRDPEMKWRVGSQETIDVGLQLNPGNGVRVRMVRGDLEAVTHVECVGRARLADHELADLEVKIETGRQHQIRAHLDFFGTPIAGDKLYEKGDAFFIRFCDDPEDPALERELIFDRHALHAWKIEFPHPVTRQTVSVCAELPQPWREVENL